MSPTSQPRPADARVRRLIPDHPEWPAERLQCLTAQRGRPGCAPGAGEHGIEADPAADTALHLSCGSEADSSSTR